jgi:hypothetical protein
VCCLPNFFIPINGIGFIIETILIYFVIIL